MEEEEEDDDLELFGGYDSFRGYNSSAGSESSSYLEESSEAENEEREAGELPTSPLHLLSPGTPRSLDGSGSEPGAFRVSLKMGGFRRLWRKRGDIGPVDRVVRCKGLFGLKYEGSDV